MPSSLKIVCLAAMFAASSSFANFYSERPCSLVQLMLTQPALQQAMRIYIDHLEMNGQTIHAEWLRLALTIDDLKLHSPGSQDLIKQYEERQQRMLARYTGADGTIDTFAQKYFRPLEFTNPFDQDLSHNFVRFDLSKPATFTMGEGSGARQVTLTESFELSRYLVTQLQYTLVTGDAPYKFKDRATMLVAGRAIDPFRPAEQVSWNDAQAMIRRLNTMEEAKKAGPRYRYFLPTEAQWEYAARGGTTGTYFFGEDASRLPEYAWFRGRNSDRTMPVGQLKPNPEGLYDTSGNVWEWVADHYGPLSSAPVTDPKVEEGRYRVCRGGSWYYFADYCRVAKRYYDAEDGRFDYLGFRLARTRLDP